MTLHLALSSSTAMGDTDNNGGQEDSDGAGFRIVFRVWRSDRFSWCGGTKSPTMHGDLA